MYLGFSEHAVLFDFIGLYVGKTQYD